MIEFQHKLPTLFAEGRACGTYNNRELAFPSILTVNDPKLGLFLHKLRANIYVGRALVLIDGKILVTDPAKPESALCSTETNFRAKNFLFLF